MEDNGRGPIEPVFNIRDTVYEMYPKGTKEFPAFHAQIQGLISIVLAKREERAPKVSNSVIPDQVLSKFRLLHKLLTPISKMEDVDAEGDADPNVTLVDQVLSSSLFHICCH
jgi:hypothetical protein